ncbi:MAG: precorrin-3B synthase [Acetobacter sp.]|uniref:precorrin-3B synthase n=1 Tax=Acetobacter sp. TaxID=440 RepID=UPI0039E7F338
MTAPLVKGWCPGALRPMVSGDGLLVRVRPPAGRLEQTQAAGIARLAAQYGNGLVELSTRGNIQLRGINGGSHAPLIAGLAALGLTDPTPEAEARRNIVVTPYWRAGDGTRDLAERLAHALRDMGQPSPETSQKTSTGTPPGPASVRTACVADLPSKFGFAIDTGPWPVLRGVSADIRIERDAAGALLCRADGADCGARVTPDTMAGTVLELVRWFMAGGMRGRMAARLSSGATLPTGLASIPALPVRDIPPPLPGPTAAGVMVGFAFGQMHAHTLAALAAIAPLRVTPWRMLLLEGQAQPPRMDHLLTRPDDPLLRVIACPGAPDCAQGLQATRPLARALAPHIPPDAVLHVSGCAKGCAQPGPTALTLVAQQQGFGLVRNGNATATVTRHVTPEHLLATPELLTERSNAPLL